MFRVRMNEVRGVSRTTRRSSIRWRRFVSPLVRSPPAIDIGQRIHGTDVVEPAAFRSNKKTPRVEPTRGAFLMDTGLVRVPFLYRGCPYRRRFFRR